MPKTPVNETYERLVAHQAALLATEHYQLAYTEHDRRVLVDNALYATYEEARSATLDRREHGHAFADEHVVKITPIAN